MSVFIDYLEKGSKDFDEIHMLRARKLAKILLGKIPIPKKCSGKNLNSQGNSRIGFYGFERVLGFFFWSFRGCKGFYNICKGLNTHAFFLKAVGRASMNSLFTV